MYNGALTFTAEQTFSRKNSYILVKKVYSEVNLSGHMRFDRLMAIIALVAIIVLGIIVVLIYGSRAPQESYGSITLSATGVASGFPSEGEIVLFVNGTGMTTVAAEENLSLTISRLNITMLPYLHNNASKIKTISYILTKRYNPSAYEASETLDVLVPEVGNVTGILEKVASLNNTYIISVSSGLSSSDISTLRNESLSLALQNATGQAEILANGAALEVSNISVGRYYVYPYASFGLGASSPTSTSSKGGSSFFEGTDEVVEQITVTFRYELR